jgi:hypothetical protein
MIDKWQLKATTRLTTVRAWWRRRYYGADVAWCLPAQTVLVDLDEKNGGHGISDFKKIDGRHPLDVATPIASTRSGGLHLFFGCKPGTVQGFDLRPKHD